MTALGVGAALALWAFADFQAVRAAAMGLGGIACLTQLWFASRFPSDRRSEALSLLGASWLLPVFAFLSKPLLALTVLIHPKTWDAYLLAADQSFGAQPAFLAGQLLQAIPFLRSICLIVYVALPISLVIALVADVRSRPPGRSSSFAVAFATTALLGYPIYLLVPVVGPIFMFPGSIWPGSPPFLPEGTLVDTVLIWDNAARNCMPSLHTAWALQVWLALRDRHWGLRIFGALQLLITLLATVGLGFHWAWDLMVSFPFVLFVRALYSPASPLRAQVLMASAALVGLLVLLPLIAPGMLLGMAPIGVVLALGVILLCWRLDRRLETESATAEESPPPPPTPSLARALAVAFFVSGFAGLCYQVVFAKSLGLAFGSTARASALVLAVYLSGIALGTWVGGRFAHRVRDPLRAYAIAEVFIAVWCALTPFTLDGLSALYVWLGHGTIPTSATLLPLQLGVALVVLFPPTMAMGATTPFLARAVTEGKQGFGRAVGGLYAANTMGAAIGAIATGYVLLPQLGVMMSTIVAVILNLGAALLALRVSARLGHEPELTPPTTSPTSSVAIAVSRRVGVIAILVLTIGGLVTLALETVFVHLLAIVVGNSAFAFALMVFCFLLGLSGGAALANRALARNTSAIVGLVVAECLLATTILFGLHFWNAVPGYFASFEDWHFTSSFAARELVRFGVCFLAMVPPALCIGAAYPFAMDLVGAAWPERRIPALGVASALNTAGNITGALLGGLVLVDTLGSYDALLLFAASIAVLAVIVATQLAHGQRWPHAAVLALPLLAAALVPGGFDMTALSSGANVYFARGGYGKPIAVAESVEGGLTTINRSTGEDGKPVHTMLTNGKFQGDDGVGREMNAQIGFAAVPLLHGVGRDKVAIIGLGTGVTARVLHLAGFAEVHLVELSRDIVALAREYFSSVNDLVMDKPNVHTHVTDGRNFLQLSGLSFDVIAIEISSIWFAGAANLYNREFYGIAKRALTPHGVLQQWIQLHRLSPQDLVAIIGSMREEFSNVWVYRVASQGVLIGCGWDCTPTAETRRQLDGLDAIHDALGNADILSKKVLLGPAGVDRLLDAARSSGEILVSTDDNLFLEYSTPRANVRPYGESFAANVHFLSLFSQPHEVSPSPQGP